MIKNLNKSVSSIEELLLFYNKYLALDNDDAFILKLIYDMTNIFNAKIPESKADRIYEIGLDELKYKEDDFIFVSAFSRKCINFWSKASINIENVCEIEINSVGNILNIAPSIPEFDEYIGKDINEFLETLRYIEGYNKAKSDVNNVIMQNILASKIYKTVREQIRLTKGMYAANAFTLINYDILNYENLLVDNYEMKQQNNKGFSRVRSQR